MTRACLYKNHINIVGYIVANWAGDANDIKVVKIETHRRIGRWKIVNRVIVTGIIRSY